MSTGRWTGPQTLYESTMEADEFLTKEEITYLIIEDHVNKNFAPTYYGVSGAWWETLTKDRHIPSLDPIGTRRIEIALGIHIYHAKNLD